jgi:hypothetical protein
MKYRRFRWLLATLLMTALFATFGLAQSVVTGDLAGTVTDPSGAVVSGATVTLKSADSGFSQTAQTSSTGAYRFVLLKTGDYRLTVTQKGFKSSAQTVHVAIGQVVSSNVSMELGSTSETLEVNAAAPLIETENANNATTYSTQQLSSLPTPGNDITSYAYSAPGIALNSAAGYGNFSAYGLPSTSNLFTTNGNDNMDPYLNLNNSGASNLSLGANELDQVAVVTNGYTAQYGRQAGAQLNAATKSGTNSFHGNAEYWWNGSTLNANDWFSNSQGSPRPFANNNQWAASFGGPIVKDKLFFFADTEGLRFVLPGASGLQYLPTPQFSQFILGNVNSASQPFYQNMMSLYAGAPGASRATPVPSSEDPSLGCGDFSGTAGFGAGGTPCSMEFTSNQNNLNTEWLLSTRVDYNFSNNDRLFGRFKTDHGVQATGTDPINPVFNANSIQPAYEGQINETHIFNSTTINQVIVSGSWYKALFTANDLPAALKTFPTTLLFADGLLDNLGGGAFGGAGDNNYPQGRIVTQYQIVDDFSKTHGSHDLKFGVNFRRNLVSDYTTGVNSSGTLTISSMSEFVNGFVPTDGTGFSDYSQAYPNFGQVRIKLYNIGAYAQDQWKATSKLALTAAIRVDRTANPSCGENCFSRLIAPFADINHDASIPYNQIIQTGQKNAFKDIEKVVLAPRFGVAYSITPDTVIRGGVGIFSDLFPAFIADRHIVNAPNVSTFDTVGGAIAFDVPGSMFLNNAASNAAFQTGFKNGATLADLSASVPGFGPPAFNSAPDKVLNPKFLEWNLAVERKIANGYSASLNYVGNHGYDVMTDNPFSNASCSPSTGTTCNFGGIGPVTPDTRFVQVRDLTNNGWSNSNGVTATFKFRPSNSFQGQFNYTWQHALDTCSNNCLLPFSASTVTSIRYQTSPLLPGTAYGSSDYDVRHNINANYVYTSKSNWSNPALKYILGNWTVAGTAFFHSGYPWSPVSTAARGNLNNVTGLRNGTPLAQTTGTIPVEAGNCSSPNTPCVEQAAFIEGAEQFTFGNMGRNTLRGPGFFDTDLNVTKNFKFGERLGFAIGANFFNILNHPNFDLPSNNLASGNFGSLINTVGAATSPYGAFLSVPLTGRIVQLNARVTF